MTRAAVAAGAAAVMLAACATPPPAALDVLSGRLALVVAAEPPQAARRFQGGFELRGNAERGELDLTNPLGMVVARARWQPGAVELLTSDGSIAFSDLDELAARAFGEPLPMAALPDWLRGRPWPQAPHAVIAQGFEQLGWTIDLAGFGTGQVVARREAPPAVTLRAQLERAP